MRKFTKTHRARTAQSHRSTTGRLLLLTLLLCTFLGGAIAQETLTVCDGTDTNNYVPIYGLYADEGVKCEYVIPAALLEGMNGGTISAMNFYLKAGGYTEGTITPSFTIFMKEVDNTTMTAFTGADDATTVYNNTLSIEVSTTEDTEVEITFEEGYTYQGGNLLIGFYQNGTSGYKSTTWYGVNQTYNSAWSGYGTSSNASGSGRKFLPKTTFTYEPAPEGDCAAPATLVADPVLAHEATLTWTGGSGTYNVQYKTAAQSWDDATTAATNLSAYTITLSGLAANTAYQARVISVCDGETSNAKGVSFTTAIACPAPTNFAVAIVPGDGTKATFSWTETGSATQWQLCIDGDEDHLITVTENPFTYDQFTPEQTYTAKVRAYCDDIDQSSWSNTVTFTPTDAYMLTVNDGTTTNMYVPIYGTWVDNITKSQFIIPATALANMQWGTISKLTFYSSNASIDWGNATFEVYMTETTETTLSALADYSTMNKVKNEGSLSISGNKMEVTLDAPYQYMGGNLMIGFLQTTSGTYVNCNWYGVTAEGASMGGYGTSVSQRNFLPKTTFEFTPGEEPSCYMPTGLAANYTGGTTATVSWTSDAAAWNMKVNGTPVEGTITNPYTLTGLELGTTYEIQVQADCGGSVSDWTNAVSFTTDLCLPEDMCEISITLTDAYGDGGGQIQVVDALTNEVLGTYTNSGSSTTYTLAVCDGRAINFVFSATDNWSYENGYVITDVNGEVIAQHEGCASSGDCDAPTAGVVATYTVNCAPATCHQPAGLTVTPAGTSAVISWTDEEASAWQLCVNDDEDNLIDVTENPYMLEDLDLSTDYTVKVRANCGDGDYSNWTPNVSFTTMECDDFCEISYVLTANAYQNSYQYGWYGSGIKVFDAQTDEQIAFLTVPTGGEEGTVTGTLALCNGKDVYFEWYCGYSADNDNILVGGYAIYDNKSDLIAGNNGPMSADVNYTMDCTVPDCMWPINFAVEPSYTSATISWEGDADNYNVKYRTAPILFYEGFEYGLDNQGWTSIANGDVPSSGDFVNGWAIYDGGHNGSKSAASRSWASQVALSADNYLITPQLDLQGTLKFWVMCTYPSAADEYEVLLSTGGTEIRDFSITLQDMTAATGDWQEVSIDLKDYEGQKGYIAIHHVYEDGEALLIDDFGLYGTDENAGRWVEATTGEASIVLNDLEMDTWYEYQVQSVCSTEEQSEWKGGTFQTLNGNIKTFNNDGDWNVAANWFPEGVPTANQTAVINATATIPAGYIATAGSITIGDNGEIVIKDGGQLQNMGNAVTVTIEKNITGYGEGDGNWYLISSGLFDDLDEDGVEAAGLINDTEANYDFYAFGGSADLEWVNMKAIGLGMPRGYGYLYANKEDVTLSFTGTAQTYAEGPYWYATQANLNYDESTPFGTMNLVGNCLTHDAELYLYGSSLDKVEDFYRINGNQVELSDNAVLAPNEGVFIETTALGQRLVIGAPEPEGAKGGSLLNIIVSSDNEKVDMVRVRFGEGNGLKKFQLNRNSSSLYMPVDGNDYAVVYANIQGEVSVNFKAEKDGTYAISFGSENAKFDYLHLIDNMTGNDVDLLATPSYSFKAKTTDKASRFKVVFAQGKNDEENALADFSRSHAKATILPILPAHGDTGDQDAGPVVELADNGDSNSDIIEANNGNSVAVKLAGRTLYKDNEWNTICLPFDVTIDDSPLAGAEARTLTDAEMTGTHVELTFGDPETTLLAGVPYIIKWSLDDNLYEPVFENVTITSTEGQTISPIDEVKFIGYYDAFNITADDDDIYYLTTGSTFKHTGVGRTLNACRAYFQFSDEAAARQFILNFGENSGTTTGIVEVEDGASKATDSTYDLLGRKAPNGQLRKGLYIKDGNKVVIK